MSLATVKRRPCWLPGLFKNSYDGGSKWTCVFAPPAAAALSPRYVFTVCRRQERPESRSCSPLDSFASPYGTLAHTRRHNGPSDAHQIASTCCTYCRRRPVTKPTRPAANLIPIAMFDWPAGGQWRTGEGAIAEIMADKSGPVSLPASGGQPRRQFARKCN